MEFKKGFHVYVVESLFVKGAVGKVVETYLETEDKEIICVEFLNWEHGSDCGGRVPSGHGWKFTSNMIQPTNEPLTDFATYKKE